MDSRVKEKYQNNYPHRPENPGDKTNNLFFIETDKDFKQTIDQLIETSCLAFDLEADSMFHFTEKICLIQMATRHCIYIIDPLAIHDMSPLSAVMEDPMVRKIFHGADYDIRCLCRDFKISVNNLFDTELAARFLGYTETGLDAVLRKKFDVTLEKKYQKKDWSQRPLPEEMIRYAANDVRYLIDLYKLQLNELTEKDRLEWVFEECEILSGVKPANADDSPLFTRFKGAGRLDPRSLAVLESLLEFRVKEAQQKDRPPFKIIGNHSLLQIVSEKPNSLKQLKELNILSDNQLNKYGGPIIEIVNKALSIPKHQLPRYPHKPTLVPDAGTSAKIKLLKVWREKKADLIKMDAGLMLNNSLLKTIAENNPYDTGELNAIPEMKNWQKKEFGKEIIAVLARGRDVKTTI
jgi:ribonuclease D